LRRSRLKRRESSTLWFKRISREHSTNGGEGETGVYMREENTSWVMGADMLYGEFNDSYIVSPKYFGFINIYPLLSYTETTGKQI
jgi:hypothetical protein